MERLCWHLPKLICALCDGSGILHRMRTGLLSATLDRACICTRIRLQSSADTPWRRRLVRLVFVSAGNAIDTLRICFCLSLPRRPGLGLVLDVSPPFGRHYANKLWWKEPALFHIMPPHGSVTLQEVLLGDYSIVPTASIVVFRSVFE